MKQTQNRKKPEEAKELMDSFAVRTGIRGEEGNPEERYLWTDAFAVQTFLGLAHIYEDDQYRQDARKLIELVHKILGSYKKEDKRSGRLSGLPEEEAQNHPTAGGLRIGKNLVERSESEAFNERLEWDRDGQYFHYITRWIQALLCATREIGDNKYAAWAAELLEAGSKFIYETSQGPRMYWKMSTDLSRPLVTGMGAQDPLEGLICALNIRETLPGKADQIDPLIKKFSELCRNQSWKTTDSLGIGGLLLNTVRAYTVENKNNIPPSAMPESLFRESLYSLKNYRQIDELNYPAAERLAFRECGLAIGLRAMAGITEELPKDGVTPYLDLANEIERFWKASENQLSPTWKNHLDINAVSLAASLVAKNHPDVFTGRSS